MASSPTILTASSNQLIASCAQLGLDVQAILADADLSERELADPDGRLPAAKVHALFMHAARASGDPLFALHVGGQIPTGAYRVFDFMTANSPTVGEGMRRLCRYYPIVSTETVIQIGAGADDKRLQFVCPTDAAKPSRAYAEYAFAGILSRFYRYFDSFVATRVRLRGRPPASVSEHQRVMRCPVEFDADIDEIVMSDAVWDNAAREDNPAMLEVIQEYADLRLEQVVFEPTMSAKLRALFVEELKGGEPTVARMAKQLGVSERSLHRHLEQEGAHFGALLAEVREALARRYLDNPGFGVAEIAFLLGFAEHSSFSRAFKRWTGLSPRAYRKRARGEAADVQGA